MSVGHELRSAREAQGLSIADVASITRVRGTLLVNMEADDFQACGGAVYARGHLRSFAAAVGLDPAPLIADFDASHESVPPVVLSEELPSRNMQGIKERGRPNWLAYGVGSAAVIVGLLGYVAFADGSSSSKQPQVIAKGATATLPSAAPATPSAAPVVPSAAPSVLALAAPVTVKLTITKATSWVQANDGTTTFEQVLTAGTTKIFTSQKLVTLRVGNAGAVDLTVNGHHIGSPGTDGEVIDSKFTPTSTSGQG